MTEPQQDWELRMAAVWAGQDDFDEAGLVAAVEQLAAELPPGHSAALYERGSAQDSTGHSDQAIPLYEAALAAGLPEKRRRQAVIQLASSLRNVGRADRSVELLTAEQARRSDELDDATAVTLALALSSLGRDRDALVVALTALTTHLTRYQRSAQRYVAAL